MRRLLVCTLVFAFATACEEEAPPPPPAPTCSLTLDDLGGKSFVLTTKNGDGKWIPEKKGRMSFTKDGDTTRVKYSVKSLTSVYAYTCKKSKPTELECWQDNPDLIEFGRALYANTGSCTEETLAQVTGMAATDEAIKTAVKSVNDEIAKLKPDMLERMKNGYSNNESMQLRGVVRVRVKTTDDECRLSVDDMFQNFSHGQSRELENIVGRGARFVKFETPLVFEDCRDVNNRLVTGTDAKVFASAGQGLQRVSPNQTLTFAYVGEDAAKEASGCAYTMDAWVDYEPLLQAAPVSKGEDGKPYWAFSRSVQSIGWHAAHLYRYKACGGAAPELIDVTCAGFKAE